MKENINYKLLYSIATRYYHTNNLEAAKILYEELVSNNIIPEFEFDVDLWNEIGAKHGAWMFFKDSMWDKYDAEEKELIQVLSRLYVRFMKYEE